MRKIYYIIHKSIITIISGNEALTVLEILSEECITIGRFCPMYASKNYDDVVRTWIQEKSWNPANYKIICLYETSGH